MKRTFALIFSSVILVAGCSKPDADVADNAKTDNNQSTKTGDSKVAVADDHSGWWCTEHSIPEHECSMCSAKFAEKCKKEGDWCEKHNRADSQCFICHPERKAFYVAKYKAKYGKEPPKPEE